MDSLPNVSQEHQTSNTNDRINAQIPRTSHPPVEKPSQEIQETLRQKAITEKRYLNLPTDVENYVTAQPETLQKYSFTNINGKQYQMMMKTPRRL